MDDLHKPEDFIEALEEEVEKAERDFSQVKGETDRQEMREKQQKATELLEQIHEQIDFLKKVAEDAEK